MRIWMLLSLLLIALNTYGQTTIKGTITDKKGETLPGVNIILDGTYDGASSDDKGQFSFTTTEKGKLKLIVSYTGFRNDSLLFEANGKTIVANFTLKEKLSKLKAVTITAGAFRASDEVQGTVLKPLDMVTTAGSNGDNFGALKTLPGTQQTNDREGLFVRGGTGSETQTFIDGTMVRNAFSVAIPDLGARGRFSPFIFKGTVFSTGGYSALYGQALSSAVILTTIDLPEKSSANFNISSVGVGGGFQKLTKDKKKSYGINYNYLDLSPYFQVLKQNIDFIQAPSGHQVDANYRMKTSETGMFKFYGYINNSNIGVRRNNVSSLEYANEEDQYKDEYGVKNINAYANFSYQDFLSKKWLLKVGFCASKNNDDINTKILQQDNQLIQDSNYAFNSTSINSNNLFSSTKLVLERDIFKENTLRFGGEFIYREDDQAFSVPNFSQEKRTKDQLKTVFAETDILISNDIALKLGARLEHSQLINKINIAPRASAAIKLHEDGQISAAYGIFYQNPDLAFLFQTNNLGYQRADHYILNYLYQKNNRLLRLEVYNKEYQGLIKTDNPTNPTYSNNNGSGYARGVELFYRDKTTFKGIDYWVSYSYIDSKRDFLNYPTLTQPSFVANHVGSVVFKKFWTKYMFGVNGTYTYSSGRPYNDLNNPDFMTGRTIDYHNVAISFNYLKNIKKAFTVFVLSLNNPFGIKQVYGYNYAQSDFNKDGQLARQEIVPSARQFVFLGMFMSWGIDRSQEVIDNNL